MDAPLLTILELMPGSTGGDEDDQELDQSFSANTIEFMVVQRSLTTDERVINAVLNLSLIHI